MVTSILFSFYFFGTRKPRETAYQNQLLVNSKPIHFHHKHKPRHHHKRHKHHKRHEQPPKKQLSAIFEEDEVRLYPQRYVPYQVQYEKIQQSNLG